MGKNKLAKLLIVTLLSTCILFTACTRTDAEKDKPAPASGNITVVSREDGSGTRGTFIELLGIEVKDSAGNRQDKTTKEAIVTHKTDVMMATIAGDKNSIGYVSFGSLNETVKTILVDEVEPTGQNIKNGSYKLARPFNIVTKGEATGLLKDFIDFILSSDGQTVIANIYIAIDDEAPAYKGTKPAGKIVVAGSSSVTPIMEKLKEAYLELNPHAEIEIQQSDSSAGMSALKEGTCDLGMASRELKASEARDLTSIGIAMDGIALIINPLNTIDGLTTQQVHDIFSGVITTWEEIL
ncbi:MAG: substrate-binding domain-containing protein [Bacillota bacterium]